MKFKGRGEKNWPETRKVVSFDSGNNGSFGVVGGDGDLMSLNVNRTLLKQPLLEDRIYEKRRTHNQKNMSDVVSIFEKLPTALSELVNG